MTDFSPPDSIGKIAVIGMAGRYPEAWNIEQFWQNIKEQRECIHFFDDNELLEAGVSSEVFSRPDYVKAAGICPGTFLFDAAFFGYTPREAEFLDPQHRVFLECAWEALEHAGYDAWTYPGRIGLFAGSGATQYLFELLSNPGIRNLADAFTLFTCGDKDFLATRVGYKLNLRGPCITVQTACSTSLVSIVMACQSLLNYQSDIALGGGVSLAPTEGEGYIYQEGGIHSPDGHCRTFDADGRGFCAGTGAGVVVLKRLDDALAEGDTIHAVILGAAITNDGATRVGFSAPGVNGQVAAISDAIALAGIHPETIGLVECHGTATPMGDPIEIAALTRAFRAYTQEKNFCAVGSVKTSIGHTDAAAGAAGFIKAVLSLKNKLIPASLHFRKPNPNIDFANSPFYVNTQLKPWTREGPPRRAAVSSFGLGGTNAHVVLGEAPHQSPSSAAPWNLLVWSARTAPALEKMSANLLDHLQTHSEDSLADVAYTLQVGRRLLPHRRTLVCRDREDAVAALTSEAPGRLLLGYREKEPDPVTFVFPGQGCQYINMGKELYSHEPVFREQVDLCAKILQPQLGLDLREILYPSAAEAARAAVTLDQIRYTSPILFTVEYALAKLWLHWGVRPAAVIGHSTGEYAAACIAGVISLEDALRLVCARGRLMQQMPAGGMTGVMLPEMELSPLLASIGGVSLAAVNGPAACVVSGPEEAVTQLEHLLGRRDVPYRRLHISHAGHSPMMDPILQEFRDEVQKTKLHAPQISYISNLSGTWATTELTDPEYWVRHLRETVRFADGVAELLKQPQRIFLEVGPGRSIGSLLAQYPARGPEHVILPSLPHPKSDSQGDLEFILTTVAQLWIEGLPIHWRAFHQGKQPHRIPLPTYPFERQHYQLNRARRGQEIPQADDLPFDGPPLQSDSTNGQHARTVMSAVHPRPNLPVPYVAPRNELERKIVQVWEDTLGITAPGINDSFVALGGHSLLALQLVGRIRAVFNLQITLTDLYHAVTIAGLADRIARQTEKARTGISAHTNGAAATRSALVPIQSSGTSIPLFLVHPAGGGIIAYHDLVKYLRADQPVYALQNLDSGNDVPRSVEDMARRYIEAIQAVSPGPYLLGGASMGGAVAFEMAVQIEAQCRQVLLAVVLDTPARIRPRVELHNGHSALAVELIMFASNVAGPDTDLRLDFADLDPLEPAEQIHFVFRRLQQAGLVSAGVSSSDFETGLKALTNNMSAFESYAPSTYGGRFAILRAQDTTPDIRRFTGELSDDPTFGWQAHCTEPATVRFVPGDHGSMNREPNIRFTAAELQRVLDEAVSCSSTNVPIVGTAS